MIERRGDLVVGIQYDAQAFNDAWKYFTGHGGYFVSNNIYSRLVVLDVFNEGQIRPDLAQAWSTPDNGTTWDFELNPAARWHDGVPVTAHDVEYTYRTVLDKGYAGATFLADVESTTAIDDHNLRIVLKAPNAAFLAQLGQFVLTHIVAKHLYAGTDWDDNPHNYQPVGSGAFMFDSWEPGKEIRLKANPDYWQEGPYVETLTCRVMGDVETAMAALDAGELHFYTMDVPCTKIDAVRAMDDVSVAVLPGHSMGFLAFNWDRPLFQDHRVREAIARTIEREPIVAQICPEATPEYHYYLSAIGWAVDPDCVARERDLDLANKLLEAAGLEPDAAGVRAKVTIGYRAIYEHYGVAARAIAEQLQAIGIDADVERADPVMWNDKYLVDGDFDMVIDAGDIGPDPQIMATFLTTDGVRNVMRYSNPIVDEAFAKGRAVVDLDERAGHYRRLQQALADDIARVPLLQHGEHLGYSTKFRGWSWDPGVAGTLPFWNHSKVRLAED